MNIMTSAPVSMIVLRRAWLMAEPAAPLISGVSAVSRLITSAECVRSKKAGPEKSIEDFWLGIVVLPKGEKNNAV